MSTSVLDKPITQDSDTDDADKAKHYFGKDQIDANFLYGTPMTAVCGAVVAQQSDPQGKPMCSKCEEWYQHAE